jgi:hypothetical protein
VTNRNLRTLAAKVSFYPAFGILHDHELENNRKNKQPPIEFAMDMHNNSVGLDIGSNPCADCEKEVDKALADGRLIWIKLEKIIGRGPDGKLIGTRILTSGDGTGTATARYYTDGADAYAANDKKQAADMYGREVGEKGPPPAFSGYLPPPGNPGAPYPPSK